MKKFITLLSAALISVASLATVASAAPITEDVFKPTIAADITKVTSKGSATITFTANVASELDLVYDEDEEIYTGFGIRGSGIKMTVNSEMFEVSEVILGEAYNKLEDVVASTDKVAVLGTVKAQLKADYIGKSVAELNALNFGEVTFAEIIISSWEEADDFSQELTQTKYRDDGQGNFGIDLSATRIGTYVPGSDEPAADVTVSAKTNSADNSGVYWGVDFAEGKFPGQVIADITDGTVTKSVYVKADSAFIADADINGGVSFAVYVITDAETAAGLSMTLNAGDLDVQYK